VSDETALLHAITANRADHTARLVYADWLDEHDQPDRAAYLRLQVRLAREWWYDKPCTELFAERDALAARLDATWLALVRRCTTPAPPLNAEEVLPELKGRGKVTVRLHPRPGDAPPDASKIGGAFVWPESEPWPHCPQHGGIPYVCALQLRKEDVPELGFPDGTDLFQLLWCPVQHDDDDSFCPKPAVFWRTRAKLKPPFAEPPAPAEVEYGHFPKACVLYPERVTEYPDPSEHDAPRVEYDDPAVLAALAVLARIPERGSWYLPDDGSDVYQTVLGACDGTKIGGYPDWVQDPNYPRCGCGATMEHLLSFGSREYDGITWARWLPVEDRPALHFTEWRDREAVGSAHGVMFGDAGNMFVFVCRAHREPHVRASMQCS
jgi:uncharacterized protein (TIGR02996 family)